MNLGSQLSKISLTILAGTTQRFTYRGIRVICVESDGANNLEVAVGDYDFVPLPKGTQRQTSDGEIFEAVTFRNTGGATITATVLVGFGEFLDARFNVEADTIVVTSSQQPATTSGGATASLAAGGSVSVAATSGGKNLVWFVVSNQATAGSGLDLMIRKGGVDFCPVKPQESKLIPAVGEAFTVNNPSGSAITYILGTAYYA